jgi:hypothetical protein
VDAGAEGATTATDDTPAVPLPKNPVRAPLDETQRHRMGDAAAVSAEAEAAKTKAEAAKAEAEAGKAKAEVEITKTLAKQADDDRALRKSVAKKVFLAVAVQVVIADLVFVKYADSKGWGNIDPSTMHVWLGATVVQTIAVALVIARSLFPSK